ncbi:MAG: efflux RND transporter periplasmic adaptor subunit [Deltaproteobacteria bacterium]|nr:efflux RND transporter periplasmic adaptor subunit [Deltaproteobacteria bacterium]TLN02966.1 MAG: efflux RND transporter periplasmic adaptor subunit [bacterium]
MREKHPMKKRMLIMLAIVGLLFGGIFGFQIFKMQMIKKSMASQQIPPSTVSTILATVQPWQPELKAVGTLRAVRGVDVTSEITGLVRSIHFKSGDTVKAGQLLVQLNADSDIAQLHASEAAAELAGTIFERDKKQFAVKAVSQAVLDADQADLKSKRAIVAEQAANVAKKSIRAPFAGRLGITTVNPGHYLNPGDKIVTLQCLDNLYADFFLPQQELANLSLGQKVILTSDSYPGRTFTGKITSINPKVDPETRNFQIEASIANPGQLLLPGMFASVQVQAGEVKKYLTVPQTAVAFNPYGETIFIVQEGEKGPDGKPGLIAKQVFVTTGAKRGDQVAILKGIKEGDTVVSAGQLKLKNGSPVVINNTILPTNDKAPKPVDE